MHAFVFRSLALFGVVILLPATYAVHRRYPGQGSASQRVAIAGIGLQEPRLKGVCRNLEHSTVGLAEGGAPGTQGDI